ncbi:MULTISPECIES: hypothetical protein [unclassified Sphingopyxis]|uniref:hypothetical protein n=1 Tax=unclassified Sphingopyxis TaxID=2614943 RepID=UPI0007367206|nr:MULTISPECIES: hypothetical protein [unclassified Sphingopyxis]KTE40437.1 hypothetical protein ATE62_08015 [Sphingopyxis sp. HIX]KTE85067.1 hypothetical protein ATE72_05155 [Sphingopyxis sp. HXXIV]
MLKVAAAAILLLLGACSSPSSAPGTEPAQKTSQPAPVVPDATPSKPSPPKPAPAVLLSPGGLVAAGQLLRFGIPRAEIEDAIGAAQGAATERGSSSECGAGTVDYTRYKDGLQLTFQDGKFAGWTINAAASPLRTAKGIGIGSTRQELDAAFADLTVEDSSLGLLFSSGDLTGLLDIDGIEGLVTDIWAGTVCLID